MTTSTKRIRTVVTAAMCMAMCVVLPMAFHAIPNAGSILSPMHIPVLLCGLICGPAYGALCGIAGPLLSSVLAGMPPVSILPPMMVECVVYGAVAGIMMHFVRTKKLYLDLYISLLVAMITGRLVAGAARAWIFAAGAYSFRTWANAYFITALPGIVIHLAMIPSVVIALQAERIISVRYPKE